MKTNYIKCIFLQLFIFQLTTVFPQGNWPQTIYGEPNVWIGMISPVIADLDNDGPKELVITTQGNSEGHLSTLFIFEANGDQRAKVNVDYYFDARSFPSIADIDNDDEMEIIMECTGPSDNQILIYDSQGNLEQNFAIEFQMSDNLYASTVLADVNNDNSLEIIYGGWYMDGVRLVVLNNNGNNLPGFPVLLEGNNGTCEANTPAVGNLDDDDDWEIVAVSHQNNAAVDSTNIRAYNIDGSILWSKRIYSISNCDPVIGDVNNDGYNEVVFTSEDGVYILDRNGNFLLNLILGPAGQGMAHSNVALADLDNDNDLEIIFGYAMDLYAIHHDGTIIFTFTSNWLTHHPPVVGDINNDGSPDILFNSDDDIYALDDNGSVLTGFPKPMELIAYSSPSIDDIDNNNKVDVISSSNWIEPDVGMGIIYVWDLNTDYQQSTMEWQMYQHDPQHTGNYLGGSIVPVELISFTANVIEGTVYLNWTTATELNNNGFEVQRKTNNVFCTIGFIQGRGTSTNIQNYSFVDKNVAAGKYTYRLKQIDFNGTFEYSNAIEVEVEGVKEYALDQNYPNPFNPTTTISFAVKEKSNVNITILNPIGEEVTIILNEVREPGYHQVEFNASNLPSGVYFYRLQAGSFVQTKKMILVK